jgi:hypothetical protein
MFKEKRLIMQNAEEAPALAGSAEEETAMVEEASTSDRADLRQEITPLHSDIGLSPPTAEEGRVTAEGDATVLADEEGYNASDEDSNRVIDIRGDDSTLNEVGSDSVSVYSSRIAAMPSPFDYLSTASDQMLREFDYASHFEGKVMKVNTERDPLILRSAIGGDTERRLAR